jgi:hypothetical protein
VKRFPDQLLVRLRNEIPVGYTIVHITQTKNRLDQNGKFRFQCSECKRFDTVINQSSNLAHCFTCKSSKNPIDLVMTKFNISFRVAVARLTPFLKETQK